MQDRALSPQDIDAKVDALVGAPLGCAFLLIAAHSGLSPSAAASPAASMRIASMACSEMEIWRMNHANAMKYALAKGPGLRPLARAVLEHPASDWWFAPVMRNAQLRAADKYGDPDEAPTPSNFIVPEFESLRRCGFDDRPYGGLYTSTLLDGMTSLFAEVDDRTTDLAIHFQHPIACWKMRARGDVRVYEINGPMDWHALCLRYPARGIAGPPHETELHRLSPLTRLDADAPIDEDSFLTLDWAAAMNDWDGVHLTLGGLLTADKVRVASAAGWTMFRFWNIEQTLWLRWAFDGVERMPDHHKADAPSGLDLRFPNIGGGVPLRAS